MVLVQGINHLLMQGGCAKGLPIVRLCVALGGVIAEVHMGCRQHDRKTDAAGQLLQGSPAGGLHIVRLLLLGVSVVAEGIIAKAPMDCRPESSMECKAGNFLSMCWHAGCQLRHSSTAAGKEAGRHAAASHQPASMSSGLHG